MAIIETQEEQIRKKPYSELKQETIDKRLEFRMAYKQAKETERDSILNDAQNYLQIQINEYFKAWYNTPWTFHGHTQTPGKGSIACGYFVTTTLQDMGFNIPRIKWAQLASSEMIKKMTSDIKVFSKKPMTDVVNYIQSKGEGLYIVGLDMHVGYIYYNKGKMWFVHSNYYRRDIGVMSEPLIGRNPLNDSKYRMIGKIFDKEMTYNWITNTSYSE